MVVMSFGDYEAGVAEYKVVATVQGLEGGEIATVRLNGLELGNTAGGMSGLTTRLADKASYVIETSAAKHTCPKAEGTVSGADVDVTVTCQPSDAMLAELSVTDDAAPVVLAPVFSPATSDYVAAVPWFGRTRAPKVVARTSSPSATLLIAGNPAKSGDAVALPFDAGPATFEVKVTATSGASRTYKLRVEASIADLKASVPGDRASFGAAVALEGDTAIVGATAESSGATGIGGDPNDTSKPGSGAAYVFTRTSGRWSPQHYVKASNTDANASFGCAAALSGDTLVVGAENEKGAAKGINGDQTNLTGNSSGAVYVYARAGGGWSQTAYVKASNARDLSSFGAALALSGDTLVVGAPGESSSATGVGVDSTDTAAPRSGAVYVFARTNGGWSQQAYIKASNTGTEALFGAAVALSGDTLVVGAYGERSNAKGVGPSSTDTSAKFAGAAYVFTRTAGVWSQQAYIKASNARAYSAFGFSVALSGDTLVVGASLESSAATGIDGDQTSTSKGSAGAAYVFTRTAGVWSQQAYVKASNTRAFASFGESVAIGADVVVVGAPTEDSGGTGVEGDSTSKGVAAAGAAYVFRRGGGTWTQRAYVKSPRTAAGARFATSIALSNDALLVGAASDAPGATAPGAAFVY
jgi:hypothetical protein